MFDLRKNGFAIRVQLWQAVPDALIARLIAPAYVTTMDDRSLDLDATMQMMNEGQLRKRSLST